MELQVKCKAGHCGDIEPVEFTLGDRTVGVAEIIDRWTGNDHAYFKIMGGDACVYILRFTPSREYWELTLFRTDDAPDFAGTAERNPDAQRIPKH